MSSSQISNLSISNPNLKLDETEDHIKYYGLKLDILRLFAICSIIWGHTILEWEILKVKEYNIIHSVLIQLGKIGTINFFIISGFLLNKRINQFNIISYMHYRKFSLIYPWLIFLSILVLIHTCKAYNQGLIFNGSIVEGIKEIAWFYRDFIVYNAYWFVPVNIISSCILIVFKKSLNEFSFFLILLICYSFYSANLYYAWVSQVHTKAIFAYTIFMWIGIQISRNIIAFHRIIRKIQWSILISLFTIVFSLGCFEGFHLSMLGSKDPYSSLRLSNSLLSLILFISFLKLPNIKWIKVLKPNYYVFGVYLIQAIVINETIPIFTRYVVKTNNSNIVQVIFIQSFVFITVLASSYILSILIKNSKIRFIMGKK